SGVAASMLGNRISYLLGLKGPSLTVDTACSSSLVALHLARESIRANECDAAIVGGVGLLLRPDNVIRWARAGMLARDSRSKTFDARADGYAPAEGVVALLVRPLVEALADGDSIYAVVKGTAINHDGHSKIGLTAPSPKAQAEVIRRALEVAKKTPEDIGY